MCLVFAGEIPYHRFPASRFREPVACEAIDLPMRATNSESMRPWLQGTLEMSGYDENHGYIYIYMVNLSSGQKPEYFKGGSIYIYICIYVCIYICIYIYMYTYVMAIETCISFLGGCFFFQQPETSRFALVFLPRLKQHGTSWLCERNASAFVRGCRPCGRFPGRNLRASRFVLGLQTDSWGGLNKTPNLNMCFFGVWKFQGSLQHSQGLGMVTQTLCPPVSQDLHCSHVGSEYLFNSSICLRGFLFSFVGFKRNQSLLDIHIYIYMIIIFPGGLSANRRKSTNKVGVFV